MLAPPPAKIHDPDDKTPHGASARIAENMLADLPRERRERIRQAIEDAIDAWGEVRGDPLNFTG